MTEDALGATLFPDYPKIPGWYAREVEGLTDAQLDFTDERVEWMKWGVRRQLSHAAFVHFHWLVNQWAPQVFGPDDEMPDFDAEACASRDRRFDEETHRTPDRLLFRMEEGVSLVRLILGRETIREMRRKELDRVVEPGARYPSGDSVLDFWRVAERINPDIRVDPKNENRFLINLVGMMRQMYLECLIHLYTIQRLKRAQGLEAVVEIPREGYMLLPAFTGAGEDAAG
ncbi:MAG: hypothetical protein QGF68_02120 [Nitrospinota bacterium]|jgi:hypothetical protein|nr:hypothetical protein [Nitrospinota bacterium]